MYSKEQASKIKQQFWTRFGQYMKPVPGINGGPVNWLNYKTGNRNIHFRLDADKQKAIIAIEITNRDAAERTLLYEQFVLLKKLLENETAYSWIWEKDGTAEHQTVSRIYQNLTGVNVMNEEDWPAIIAFLKPRIIALDHFWNLVKDAFE